MWQQKIDDLWADYRVCADVIRTLQETLEMARVEMSGQEKEECISALQADVLQYEAQRDSIYRQIQTLCAA